jgi:hypothetical protein
VARQPQSFYASEAPGRGGRGRLLLFAYHFPPDAAAGALRWQKLAVNAAERGWGLDVFTRDPAELTRSEFCRLRELPPGVRVFGVRQPELAVQRLERRLLGAYRRLVPARRLAGVPARREARPSSFARDELRFSLHSLRTRAGCIMPPIAPGRAARCSWREDSSTHRSTESPCPAGPRMGHTREPGSSPVRRESPS